jgi:hypothetical protein
MPCHTAAAHNPSALDSTRTSRSSPRKTWLTEQGTGRAQDSVGSAFAFAAIVHLGATLPARLLRCVLNCAEMVRLKTAESDARFSGGGILPTGTPWLAIQVGEEVLGEPEMKRSE